MSSTAWIFQRRINCCLRLRMAHNIAALIKRAKAGGIPVIYVNDNFGRWRSDFCAQVEHCLQTADAAGRSSSCFAPSRKTISC